MEDEKVPENHLSSAAAFVEGGIQEACDDACSICLEDFSDSDPSTVTNCKHEFHLQCILEWYKDWLSMKIFSHQIIYSVDL
ncbi:E3 ubiquitin- ligase RHF2A-like [Olea europaea subsp. europaea]|uniref:RING-type E3 ubiquitin transferase n=1 Tax=Olea europaea subsp. europaea TaxID=158383 RepID=A0A8S0S942_OLEEU|nr:E3 ubiquitin- ligase RHF2A-like [Olea europaea subsp. europaea]